MIAVIGLSMGYATSTPVMERSQIAQMEQIAPIAASVSGASSARGLRFKTLCIGFEPNA